MSNNCACSGFEQGDEGVCFLLNNEKNEEGNTLLHRVVQNQEMYSPAMTFLPLSKSLTIFDEDGVLNELLNPDPSRVPMIESTNEWI